MDVRIKFENEEVAANNAFHFKHIKEEPIDLDDIENIQNQVHKADNINKGFDEVSANANIKTELDAKPVPIDNIVENFNCKDEIVNIKKEFDEVSATVNIKTEFDEKSVDNNLENFDYNVASSKENINTKSNESSSDVSFHDKRIKRIFTKSNQKFYDKYIDVLGYTVEDCNIEAYNLSRHSQISQVATKKYTCIKCKFEVYSKAGIEHHAQTHGDKFFQCNICKERHVKLDTLKAHIIREHVEKHYKCEKCSFQSDIRHKFERHLESHLLDTNEKIKKCFKCKFETRDKLVWKKHIMEHQKLKCKLCNKEYRVKHQYNLHLRYDHSETELKFLHEQELAEDDYNLKKV